MLPPFVPPGARKAVPELLPSIQEFAVDRRGVEPAAAVMDQPAASVPEAAEIAVHAPAPAITDQAPELSLDAAATEPLAQEPAEELPSEEEQLPSIEAFLLVRSAPEERVIDTEVKAGVLPAEPHVAAAVPEVFAPVDFVAEVPAGDSATRFNAIDQDAIDQDAIDQDAIDQDAIDQDAIDPAAEAETQDEEGSGDRGAGDKLPVALEPPPAPEPPAPSAPAAEQPVPPGAAPQSPPEENWLDTERNLVDWSAAGRLGASGPDDSRAAAEWSATDWDSAPSAGDDEGQQVAAALVQVARRIRGGELRVEAAPGMSVEAALASALTALLRKGPRE